MMTPPLKIGISRCLLGEEVRYDGTGARSSLPHDRLEGLFEYVDVCPEVAIGMSVPRPPIRVVRDGDLIQVVGVSDPSQDFAPQLREEAERYLSRHDDIHGFIFMHNSPSCGSRNVKVYPPGGGPGTRDGRGAFAASVIERWPGLPYEDAGRLYDDAIRENFVMRTFAQARWVGVRADLTPKSLIEFHSAYKYLLMAHSSRAYREAGQLLSDLSGKSGSLQEKADRYHLLLMSGLAEVATRGGHANVLSHIQGYLKKALSSESRQELAQLIDGYRRGEQPLLAPVALLKHHFRENPNDYIEMQTYLEPHPAAAALRRPL